MKPDLQPSLVVMLGAAGGADATAAAGGAAASAGTAGASVDSSSGSTAAGDAPSPRAEQQVKMSQLG